MRNVNRNNNLTHLMKILAVIFLMLFLANAIMSLLYTSMEAGHHCEEKNCPVCETILICENSIRNLCGFSAIILLSCGIADLVCFISKIIRQMFIGITLVSQGIRMND